jgi:Tachylectin
MKLLLRKFSSCQWKSSILLAALFLLLTTRYVQAEPPHVQLRPLAPGWIAIDWEHPNDGAAGVTLERENPAFTWVFTELVNSFVDMGLEPSRAYRYRVCAQHAQPDCTPWLAAQTLAAPAPPVVPDAPSFINSSARINSITINWTSSASYSFHQVRWAENGHRDGQNRVNGRSFTANGLRPGTYHFIVQGCNRTLLGSSCSRFSTPIEVTTHVPPNAPLPPAVSKGVIYGVTLNDDLLWNRHEGRNDGSFSWAFGGADKVGVGGGKKVGTGWNFKHLFSGGNGILYVITPRVEASMATGIDTKGNPVGGRPASGGDLMWYRHTGREDGSFKWSFSEGKKVGVGWWNLEHVFSGGDGIIYTVTPRVEASLPTGIDRKGNPVGARPASGGDLMWYRHDGRNDGSFRWAFSEGKKVGVGWGNLKHVFSGGDGVIYAITDNGDLMWYRHDGRNDGSFRWAFSEGKKVGVGWGSFKHVFSGGDGVIYAIANNGDLMWHRHDGRNDGSFRWAFSEGKKVGVEWSKFNFKQIFPD